VGVVAPWDWRADTYVAISTFGLAVFTAALAWSTRTLARAAATDQRAQWRPVVISEANTEVDYLAVEGTLLVRIRNVGRGPALGINAELRVGKNPAGASTPRDAVILAPGELVDLDIRVSEQHRSPDGPSLAYVDVSYYDVTERWHLTRLTITAKDEERDGQTFRVLRVRRVILHETGRSLLPVHGSLHAQAADDHARRRPWRRLTKRG
jgi:hypothetical protein